MQIEKAMTAPDSKSSENHSSASDSDKNSNDTGALADNPFLADVSKTTEG